jgi:hypothetical protein
VEAVSIASRLVFRRPRKRSRQRNQRISLFDLTFASFDRSYVRCALKMSVSTLTIKGPMTTTSLILSSALQKHIKTLSVDCSFTTFPPDNGQEDLVLMERKNAEEAFQRAFCQRIWWNLSPEERSEIRLAVRQADSYYQNSSNEWVDMQCMQTIRRMIGS